MTSTFPLRSSSWSPVIKLMCAHTKRLHQNGTLVAELIETKLAMVGTSKQSKKNAYGCCSLWTNYDKSQHLWEWFKILKHSHELDIDPLLHIYGFLLCEGIHYQSHLHLSGPEVARIISHRPGARLCSNQTSSMKSIGLNWRIGNFRRT